jgi:hypothetical protein
MKPRSDKRKIETPANQQPPKKQSMENLQKNSVTIELASSGQPEEDMTDDRPTTPDTPSSKARSANESWQKVGTTGSFGKQRIVPVGGPKKWCLVEPDWDEVDHYNGFWTRIVTPAGGTRALEKEVMRNQVKEHVNRLRIASKLADYVYYVKVKDSGYHLKRDGVEKVYHWTLDFFSEQLEVCEYTGSDPLDVYHVRLAPGEFWKALEEEVDSATNLGQLSKQQGSQFKAHIRDLQ